MVWALATLYAAPLGEHLVFKGGTSLSKAYQVIRRFSEDVDLTYDIRAIAPDLVGDNGEGLPKTRSEEKRWSSEVRRRLPAWVAETVQPVIAKALAAEGLAAAVRVEDEKLFIDYEATAAGPAIAPSVMLGSSLDGRTSQLAGGRCDAATIDGLVSDGAAARHARGRTFWEKATAIHVFAFRSGCGDRFARHWHDVVGWMKLASRSCFADPELANAVALTSRCSSRKRPPTARSTAAASTGNLHRAGWRCRESARTRLRTDGRGWAAVRRR